MWDGCRRHTISTKHTILPSNGTLSYRVDTVAARSPVTLYLNISQFVLEAADSGTMLVEGRFHGHVHDKLHRGWGMGRRVHTDSMEPVGV